jgi:polysaccharide deacetylase family protein (PEP-CTERM system associated)
MEAAKSKRLLEDIIGQEVSGYRASTYSIVQSSLWALDVLCELGFKYDSSIFPIRHDLYGIPSAPRRPGTMTTPGGRSILEFPMTTASVFGFHVPVSGGGYFRLLPYWFTRSGLRQVNHREKSPFVFYLHPWEIDAGQPRLKVKWRSRIRHYTNLGRTEGRLERLLTDFEFAPMRTVLSELGLS